MSLEPDESWRERLQAAKEALRKRKRLCKDFMALPEKHQFILGRPICSHIEAMGWKP